MIDYYWESEKCNDMVEWNPTQKSHKATISLQRCHHQTPSLQTPSSLSSNLPPDPVFVLKAGFSENLNERFSKQANKMVKKYNLGVILLLIKAESRTPFFDSSPKPDLYILYIMDLLLTE